MASDLKFIEFIVEQFENLGEIRYRSMFGEYVVYANDKVFALVCDNKLFIKPTEAGRSFIGTPVEAPPYPGARNSFLIEEKLEDRDWLCELVRRSLPELPLPKPRKKKR